MSKKYSKHKCVLETFILILLQVYKYSYYSLISYSNFIFFLHRSKEADYFSAYIVVAFKPLHDTYTKLKKLLNSTQYPVDQATQLGIQCH